MTSESERTTRQERIDPRLQASGWIVTPYHPAKLLSGYTNHAITEYPTANGPADYALVVDGAILGIVEAKKLTVSPSGVLVQAERYSEGVSESPLNCSGFRVPFLYSTNGQTVRFHDVRDALNLSRQIQTFHSPAALRELFARSNEGHIWLADNAPEHTRLRDYQKAANTEIENAIIGGKRQMLVAMATGTGKTFTAVNQCYRLLKSKTARRIMFLVDRRALAAQGVRAFSVFEPEPNLKFDKLYEVYSNKFQKEDFGATALFGGFKMSGIGRELGASQRSTTIPIK